MAFVAKGGAVSDRADPEFHRDAERELVRHVERLVQGEAAGRAGGLAVDTRRGRMPVTRAARDVTRSDQTLETKRLMVELDRPDHDLQRRLPAGEVLDVSLGGRTMMIFPVRLGHLRVASLPPVRELIEGVPPAPVTTAELKRRLKELPPPVGRGGPETQVVLSTAGFTPEARALAFRDRGGAMLLVEPDGAGGWLVSAPKGLEELARVLNPEGEGDKRRRVRDALDARQLDLLTGGVSLARVADDLKLPARLVEAEAKAHAKQHAGLVVKTIEGRPMLYREGTGLGTADPANFAAKGPNMPMIDRLKTLFTGRGEAHKKVAFLSERRAALTQQRDAQYDEIGLLETKEAELRETFKQSDSPIVKRRLTSQILQLQKDLARKQQLVTVLNQQVNVVGTHLHNLELVKQGQAAALPDPEEMAEDAARAEEVLADLQAGSELADSVGGLAATGMTDEEQALFDQLEAANAPPPEPQALEAPAQPATPQRQPTTAPPNKRPEPELG